MLVKTLKVVLLAGLLFLDAVFLGMNPEQLVTAIFGVLSGSFILTYYRKGLSMSDRVIKILCSSLGGLFVGAAANQYFRVESLPYFGIIYFLSSFLVLIFLRAILSVTEKNATGIVTAIVSRKFKLENDGVAQQTKIVTSGASQKDLKTVHENVTKEAIHQSSDDKFVDSLTDVETMEAEKDGDK